MFSKFNELYNYRQMIAGLVHRELRGRYKGSVLGFLWTFLNPLLQWGVYYFLFGIMLRNDIPNYSVYLFIALVPWLFFSNCLASGCSCILFNQNLVTKIYFPREVLPLSFTISSFVNMLYCFIVVFIILIISGIGLSIVPLLYLPLVFMVEFLLSLGVTLLFCSLTVYLQDLAHILGIIAMLMQFTTPIFFSFERVPEEYKTILQLNPMCSIIECYRSILYYKEIPDISTLGLAVVYGVVILVVGELLFSKLQKGFAEEM